MNEVILHAICSILNDNKKLLRIAMQQRAKFEGWLKFELAGYLANSEFSVVSVERSDEESKLRSDIFFKNSTGQQFCIELKTSNTNWNMPGVVDKGKPITKNIRSIITDSRKQGADPIIVGFVLFPIGLNNILYENYLTTIIENTGVRLIEETHYRLVEMEVDDEHKCRALVCTFTALVN